MTVWVLIHAPLLCQALVGRVVVYFCDVIVFLKECVDEALCFPAAILWAFGGGRDERGFAPVDIAWFK